MTRIFSISVLAILAWIGLTVGSFAQADGTNLTPLPAGDQGWCTVTREAPAGTAECGFMSAEAACERQITSFYPRGRRTFAGVTDRNTTTPSASCEFDQDDTINELIVGIAGVNKPCMSGFSRSGATCRRIECSTCGAGDVGNPINFISGEKKDVRIDYQSFWVTSQP